MSDISFLVDRLEELVRQSWHIPMSTYLIVDEDEVHGVLDQIRTAIPKEIKQAARLIQERETTLSQAEADADRIIESARIEAERLADDHEIIQAANVRAQTIIERAQREAEGLKLEADEYARGVLQDLDTQLATLELQIADLKSIVRNGMNRLAQARQAGPEELL
jgi:cell division septum initiation protein DivIVA